MDCPYCGFELNYHDYYGRICSHQDGKIFGDIYTCENEECDHYQEHFYTRIGHDELCEGYPC